MKNERILLCGIGKLENCYIREWVEYHKNLGFTNIVLYDNNDKDGERFEDVIGDYIRNGYVIMRDRRGVELAQIPAYNDCYKEFKKDYDWIGYWDIDEFIEFEQSGQTIQQFLSKPMFNKYQSIRLCWKQYTDNGLITVDDENYSVTRFTEVFDKQFCVNNGIPVAHYITSNTQAKAIIRTNVKDFNVISPHCYLDVPTVTADGKVPPKNHIRIGNVPVWKGAWLNHYRFKTIEEYVKQKMVRLWPTKYMNGGKDRLNLDYFFMFNVKTQEKVNLANEILKKNTKKTIKVNSWIKRNPDGTLKKNNWGDDVNYYFLPNIFNARLIDKTKKDKGENYCFIGSIINDNYVDENTIIWGSGVQTRTLQLKKKPKKVCAVRGPLTRLQLMKKGISCPEIYGDPTLLLPYFYSPKLPKKYKIGFIPHWSSIDTMNTIRFKRDSRVHLIKMSGYKKWTDVIDEIVSCEYIVSESLHGLIMAEAYGIPNLWVDVSLKGVYDIKFHDFFLSMKEDRREAVKVDKNFNADIALKLLKNYKKGTMPNLKKLVEACPIEINNSEFLERIYSKTPLIVEEPPQMVEESEEQQEVKKPYEPGISICITAYKAQKYLKETLDSVYNQTWFLNHNNWEVLLGIDGCEETLEYVKTIMGDYKNLRVFMMDSNQGTYITTNTIMSQARYDGLIRFDSDDIMLPEMVERIMTKRANYDVVRFKMQNFGKNTITNMACGQIYMKHDIFDEFGGYQPWKCNADSEMEKRVHKFVNLLKIQEVLLRRRIHDTNLTVAKDTNFQSSLRRKYISYVLKLHVKSRKEAVINKVTNTFTEIYNSIEENYTIQESKPIFEEAKPVLKRLPTPTVKTPVKKYAVPKRIVKEEEVNEDIKEKESEQEIETVVQDTKQISLKEKVKQIKVPRNYSRKLGDRYIMNDY